MERKHITDGKKCWCNPKVIKVKPMKKKPRVVWCVEPKTKKGYALSNGLLYGMWFETRYGAEQYGKPVEFKEVVKCK